MTEKKTSLYKKCDICTGCGRCAWDSPDMTAVTQAAGKERFWEKQDIFGESAVIAADIGTTTVVMQLRRLSDGQVLDTYRAVNPQRRFGADVLSRIQAAEEAPQKAEMRRLILEVLEQGIERFRLRQEMPGGSPPEGDTIADTEKAETPGEITGMVIAANTVMVHLLMGYETAGLGKAPFCSQHLEEIQTCIGGVETVIMPGISAFVGGDITAGLYAMEFYKSQELCLFIDLGTNGEMALGNQERILATAAAAGPAFEGRTAVGIWGSDLVAMTAELVKRNMAEESGLLKEPYFEQGVRIGSALLTQQDIRSLQMAKAAIYAGIRLLCSRYGVDHMSRIPKVYLAGGFGYFLNPDAAIAIGLLPRELKGRITAVGNTALEGAFCYARQRMGAARKAAGEMEHLIKTAEEFNLALQEEFNELYIQSMVLEEL